jgi:hypothetical protein
MLRFACASHVVIDSDDLQVLHRLLSDWLPLPIPGRYRQAGMQRMGTKDTLRLKTPRGQFLDPGRVEWRST